MSDTTAENRAAAKKAVAELRDLKQEITDIEGIVNEEHPAMWERYEECRAGIKAATDKAKTALRLLSPGYHEFGETKVEVRKPPEKLKVDTDGLIDRAEDRGELQDLIDAGVLTYAVVPHQIARLSGKSKAIYSTYLTKEIGTPAIVLPKSLK